MSRAILLRAVLLALAGLSLAAGCIRHPDVDGDKLKCMSDDNCLPGYECSRKADDLTQAFGTCVKPDGSIADAPATDAARGEVAGNEAAPAIDGPGGSMGPGLWTELALQSTSSLPSTPPLIGRSPRATARRTLLSRPRTACHSTPCCPRPTARS